MSGHASWRSTSELAVDLDRPPCLLLVLAAYLAVAERSGLALGHLGPISSGLDRVGAAWMDLCVGPPFR
jgi:hypothetical protein